MAHNEHKGIIHNHHDSIDDESSSASEDVTPRPGEENTASDQLESISNEIHPSILKSVSNTIEKIISEDLDSEIETLIDADPSVWKTEAYNISKQLFNRYQKKIEENLKEFLYQESEKFTDFPLPHEGENDKKNPESNSRKIKHINETQESIIESKACQEIVHRIGSDNNTDVRLKYLQTLLHLQTIDDIDSDSWMEVIKKLRKNLTDENLDIFKITVQIHLKLCFSNSSFFLKEAVKNLVELLYHQYHFRKFPNLEINSDDELSQRIICAFLSLIEILKNVGQNVTRINDKILQEVVSSFINLIFAHPFSLTDLKQIYQTETLCPYAFLSALDPNASWLTVLLFNLKSRQITLSVFKEKKKFFQHKVQQVFEWFQLTNTNTPIPAEQQAIISGSVKFLSVKYAMFIHTMSMFSQVCHFSAGKEIFFEICGENKSVSYESLVVIMVQFLNNFFEFEKAKHVHFSNELIDLITNVINEMLPVENSELLQFILAKIFIPLKYAESISRPYADFLIKIFDNPTVVKFIISLSSTHNFFYARSTSTPDSSMTNSSRSKRSSSGCESQSTRKSDKSVKALDGDISLKIFIEHLHIYMNTHSLEDVDMTEKLLRIATKFFILPDTLILMSLYIHSIIFDIFQLISIFDQNSSLAEKKSGDSDNPENETLKRIIRELLTSIFSSPIGMPFLEKKNLPRFILGDFPVTAPHQWNEPAFRILVANAINYHRSRQILIKNNFFTICPFQNLLQSEAFYMPSLVAPQKEIYHAFMDIIFTLSLSSTALKDILSQTNNLDANDAAWNIEEELDHVNVLYIIPCNLFHSSDSQSIFHFIALSALKVLFQNIDSCICLLLKFDLQERLADERFTTNSFRKSRDIIVDECSLLRWELINISNCPGVYPTSQFYLDTSISDQKLKTAGQRKRPLSDLNKFLFDTKKGLHDLGWLKLLRKAFLNSLREEIKCSTVLDTVDQVSKCGGYLATKCIQWSLLEKKYPSKLSQFDEKAVALVLQYGEKNNLLNEKKVSRENYNQFLSRCKTYFLPSSESSVQFDWFSATIFLICAGNTDRSLQVSSLLSGFPSTQYTWQQLAEKRGQIWSTFGQLIEWLLSVELPQIHFLFKTKGVSWWLIYKSWMQQCFWNQLPWNEILQWILLIILYPVDYQIYFSISIIKFSQEDLLLSDQNDDFLAVLLNMTHNYHLADQTNYFSYLHRKYSIFLLQNLQLCPDYTL